MNTYTDDLPAPVSELMQRFTRIQSADPMDGPLNTGWWVALHMDLDYYQAWLVEVRQPYRYTAELAAANLCDGPTMIEYLFVSDGPDGRIIEWSDQYRHEFFDRDFDRWQVKRDFITWVAATLGKDGIS